MENLLIHSVEYEAPTENDRDGNTTYAEPVTLDHVRVVMDLSTVRKSEGESKNDVGTLYYMPCESDLVLEELARITWQGKTYTIRKVHPCYTKDGDTIHHYEAALV